MITCLSAIKIKSMDLLHVKFLLPFVDATESMPIPNLSVCFTKLRNIFDITKFFVTFVPKLY